MKVMKMDFRDHVECLNYTKWIYYFDLNMQNLTSTTIYITREFSYTGGIL